MNEIMISQVKAVVNVTGVIVIREGGAGNLPNPQIGQSVFVGDLIIDNTFIIDNTIGII